PQSCKMRAVPLGSVPASFATQHRPQEGARHASTHFSRGNRGSALAGSAAWSQATRQNKRYRIIDTHVHIFNTHTNLPAHFKRLGNVVYDMANAEAAVNALRRGGVDKAFLISYSSVDIHQQMPKGIDPKSLLPLYSKEYAIATWKKYPDLFYWFPDHIDP